MRFRSLAVVGLALASSIAWSLPADASTKSTDDTYYGVYGKISLTFSTQYCSNQTAYKLASGSLDFSTSRTDRRVVVKSGNLAGMSVGVVCGGGGKTWEAPFAPPKTGMVLSGKGSYSEYRAVPGAPYVAASSVINNWVKFQVNEVISGRVYTHAYCWDNIVKGGGVC